VGGKPAAAAAYALRAEGRGRSETRPQSASAVLGNVCPTGKLKVASRKKSAPTSYLAACGLVIVITIIRVEEPARADRRVIPAR